LLSKDSFNCGIDSLLCSKYLVTAWKDFALFSKNVLTNDFDFIFDGFDFVFGGFDFISDGFDFDFGIIKQGLLKIVKFFGETFPLKAGVRL